MAEDKPQPNVNIPPEPTKPDQIEVQQGQAGMTTTQMAPRAAPPRQPLFRK